MSSSNAEPAFDNVEVGRILERAAELDARAPDSLVRPGETESGRLSLPDLQSIAREAGIARHHVQTAAAELMLERTAPLRVTAPIQSPLGLANRLDVQRIVPVTLNEHSWSEVVQAFRSHVGVPGVVSDLAGVREWHSRAEGGAESWTLRAEPLSTGGTRLSVSQNTSAASTVAIAFGATFALICAVFLVLFLLVPPDNGLAQLPATLGSIASLGALVTGGTIVAGRRRLKRTKESLEALVDRVELALLRGS